jgi:hypothetical protein
MIPVPSGVRVWLATGQTDMRRGMKGLALQVQERLKRPQYPRIRAGPRVAARRLGGMKQTGRHHRHIFVRIEGDGSGHDGKGPGREQRRGARRPDLFAEGQFRGFLICPSYAISARCSGQSSPCSGVDIFPSSC